jgi:hypothetical protein
MVDEEQPPTKEVTNLPVIRSEAFVEIYANYVSFAASAWDMTVMLGRTVTDDPRNPHIEQRASISLSPQTAKVLTHMLLQNIQCYEQQYGEIRLTPIQAEAEEPSASEPSQNPPQPQPQDYHIINPHPRRALRLRDDDEVP